VQVELAELSGERKTLVGLHETVRPVEGLTDTSPEKFPRLVRVMVADALEPDWKPTADGSAATLNPDDATTLTLTKAVWDSEALVPVMVTV
jgi:hypothetical protein